MSANERRRAIIEALCKRRYDTSENLASEFGVSVRTILNDLIVLSLEYPIYTIQGNGGGVYVEEHYRLDRNYLTDEQTRLLEELEVGLSGKKAEIMHSILKSFRLDKHNAHRSDLKGVKQ